MTFFHECQMFKVSRIVYLFSWKKKSDNAIMGAAAPLLVGIKRINFSRFSSC